jgi:branched-chain amino acid transport system permease protein
MAFSGIGAYTSTFLSLYTPIPIPINIIIGGLIAVLCGFLIGKLVLRVRGVYLALFTIAFSELLRIAITAEHQITRGDFGLEVPPLFLGTSKLPYYYTMLAILLLSMLIMWLLINSKAGLYFRSIRENEDAASSLGVNVVKYKILAFVVTSFFAGVAGAFYGHYILILSPNTIRISEMGLVIAMSIIGGIESLTGAFIGALTLEFLSEFLRDYGEWRLVIFGGLLVLTLRFFRNGLIYPILVLVRKR